MFRLAKTLFIKNITSAWLVTNNEPYLATWLEINVQTLNQNVK
jgi:hypothetical protein